MDELQLRAEPRVTAAIAAVKDGVAEQYRALVRELPSVTAHARWRESHGALCLLENQTLIRLSEEVGNLLVYASETAVDPERIATSINDAASAILAHMDDVAASLPDQPARLLAAYRAVLQARGVEEVPENHPFHSDVVDAPANVAVRVPKRLAEALANLNQAWSDWTVQPTQADALLAAVKAMEDPTDMVGAGVASELLVEILTAMRAQTVVAKGDPDVAMEVTAALIILEHLVRTAPGAQISFARRAANACARLRACRGDGTALLRLPPMEMLDAEAQREAAKVALLAQANTIIDNSISVLKVFYEDPQTRGALAPLEKPLAQCVGMFTMLQDEAAAATVRLCREEIGLLASGPNDDIAIKDRLARRLTALAEYISASRRGVADLAVLLARAGLEVPAVTPAKPAVENTVELAPALTTNSGEPLDTDVLEIFLEEALEVLATVDGELQASEKDPDNAERLVALRRAFHTLKGSGRMVGLTQLGEAAWEMEQVFHNLEPDVLPVRADLYRLVALAHESFARWIAELRTGRPAVVDASILTDWARRVRAGERLPATVPTGSPAPGTLSDTLSMQAVTIGETRISTLLYKIFLEEARQHIAVLESYSRRMATDPEVAAEPDFLRAAHTLCGISATVGFDSLSDLASSLERLLLRAATPDTWLDSALRVDVGRAIEYLSNMVERIAEGHPPGGDAALIEALNNAAITKHPNARTERRITRLDDDIDEDLLAVFLAEAEELLPHIGQNLRDWRARSDDKHMPQSLQRLLHTLKGSARMAGAMAVGELTHRMETRVENGSRLAVVPESLHDELDASYDRLNELLDALLRRESEPTGDSQNLTPVTLTGDFQPLTPTTVTQPVITVVPTQPTIPGLTQSAPPGAVSDATFDAAPSKAVSAQRAVLRVRAESAERLANQAGEVAIARARAESELRGARTVMRELTDNIIRLRGQLREIEIQAEMQMQSRIAQTEESNARFDPLEFDRFTRLQELTRLMAESVNDVATVQQNLMRNLDEGEAALGAQARTTRELQDDLVRIRMAPFSSLSDRLYRVARVASRDVSKRVKLDIRGGHAELDRGVLDRIVAPLEHLLRNSIAHGIESEPVRIAAGKPEAGEIVIEVRQEGNEVAIGIADDGAGLDIARIRSQALAKGLMRTDEALSDAQIADFVFRSGFTTAENVSEIAGRGVGLDVVRNEIANLGGRIEMHFERGKGTRFTIYLSLTLAVMNAVVIRVGDELYTVPSLLVEQVQSLKPDSLAAAYSAREIVWRDTRYPLHYLAHLLGRAQTAPSQQRYNPVLLLRSGPHRAALHVDQLLGGQEIVVKSIGPQLARIPGVTGGAVLASGETVLILNPVQLAQRAAPAAVEFGAPAIVPAPAATAVANKTSVAKTSEPVAAKAAALSGRQATVLVVDDSLTVRKITSRTLTREGYNVVVAKDGIEALEKMQARAPDVIVTDIEMPRMDGFDLTRNVRADPQLKDLPVIMITSRTADKHRQHAAELGVTVFLGKPYEERELLENIAGVARVAA